MSSPKKTSLRTNSGFTLLELLIVLMIVGVMVSLVSLNIGAKPSSSKQAAQQLQQLLALAQEEAILKGQILGWKITPIDYGFYRYKNKQWQLITGDKILHNYPLSEELNYTLELDNRKINYANQSPPQILLLPDALLNNFTVLIQLQDKTASYKIYSEQGKIKMLFVAEKK